MRLGYGYNWNALHRNGQIGFSGQINQKRKKEKEAPKQDELRRKKKKQTKEKIPEMFGGVDGRQSHLNCISNDFLTCAI